MFTKYLPVLSSDPIYSKILSKGRTASSLGRWLSPSLYISTKAPTHWLQFIGTFKCGINSCSYCPYIKSGDIVSSVTTGKSHKILSFINCNKRFVVYVITCILCPIQYVGRTTRRLKDRLYDHLPSQRCIMFSYPRHGKDSEAT